MTGVAFGLIGPLDIRCHGQAIAVPGARQRSLLAALLLRANQPVAKHALCAAVWAGRVPDRAEDTLRSYVMRLRRVLGPVLAGRVVVRPPGYLFRLDAEDELDLLRFQGCLRRGKAAAAGGDWELALRAFSDGLSLWRGEPLCDVPSDTLQLSVIPALTELRTQIWEGRYAAALRLGRAAGLVVELQRLTEEDPLSERFSALLMSALGRCGRRIDALAEFRRLRQALITEHGVEPGKAACELHQRLLRDEDPGAAEAAPGPGTPAPAAPPGTRIPRQLPRGAAVFTGREQDIRDLVRDLSAVPAGPGTGAVAAITGFPGIGKTELAIQVAHQVASRFPDGQLYADLRGSRPDPATPGQLAGRFLRALGVPPAAVPQDEPERVAQYRSMLATRRMLVVLDDARDADQVRPLIPGSASCGTLVTARRCLAHLPEARSRILAELSSVQSAALLRALTGQARVRDEPAAVAAIAAACGGVPLALAIAGARLVARPGWPVWHLARLLADERDRLDVLAYGGLSMRERLETAYLTLAGPGPRTRVKAVRAVRLLGRSQRADVTAAQAAVLFGQSLADATAALEVLVDAGLLVSPAPASYRLPVLMRIFAADCARRPMGRARTTRPARCPAAALLPGRGAAARLTAGSPAGRGPGRNPAERGRAGDTVEPMDDKEILAHIDDLIKTEHELRAKLAAGEISTDAEHQQLAAAEAALDQCWDLLRQRRARREFGEDPAGAEVRPVSEVEGYRQ